MTKNWVISARFAVMACAVVMAPSASIPHPALKATAAQKAQAASYLSALEKGEAAENANGFIGGDF